MAEGTAEAKALEGTGEGKRLKAIGEEAIKQIKIVELIATAIENGKIKIVPDVLVSGGGTAGDGLMGQLARLLPGVDLNAMLKKQGTAPEIKA